MNLMYQCIYYILAKDVLFRLVLPSEIVFLFFFVFYCKRMFTCYVIHGIAIDGRARSGVRCTTLQCKTIRAEADGVAPRARYRTVNTCCCLTV